MENITLREVQGIKIDPEIFTFKYSCICRGDCCRHGVALDLTHRQTILAKQTEVIAYMDDTQSSDPRQWFDAQLTQDDDFPSHYAARTQIVNNKCAFLNKQGLCSLQLMSVATGEHKWHWKPFYCWLYPLSLIDNVLTIDKSHMCFVGTCNNTDVATVLIYEACREELKYLFGDKGFQQLEQYKNEVLEKNRLHLFNNKLQN